MWIGSRKSGFFKCGCTCSETQQLFSYSVQVDLQGREHDKERGRKTVFRVRPSI